MGSLNYRQMKNICCDEDLSAAGLVPPRIVCTPNGTTVNEGDSFHLTCDHSESDPVARVYWLLNGSMVTEQGSQLQVLTTDALQFTNISRNYSGEYNCTIQDDRNDTVSSIKSIIVQCKSHLLEGVW